MNEKNHIKRLSEQPLNVISVGGGAFLNEEIRKACLSQLLCVLSGFIMGILEGSNRLIIDSRPVLQNKSLEQIEELFYSRQPAYSCIIQKYKQII